MRLTGLSKDVQRLADRWNALVERLAVELCRQNRPECVVRSRMLFSSVGSL